MFIYVHSKREQKKSSPIICLRYSELSWDLSSEAVCLGLILLALYHVPHRLHSVNVFGSARRAQTSTTTVPGIHDSLATTRCSFNGRRLMLSLTDYDFMNASVLSRRLSSWLVDVCTVGHSASFSVWSLYISFAENKDVANIMR